MAALFPAFITTVGGYLDTKTPKTEKETADFIAAAYRVAVSTATITSIPGSFILTTPAESGIADGFLEAFNLIKEENEIKKSHFSSLSDAIISFWDRVRWSTVPPTGYVGPDPAGFPGPGVNYSSTGVKSNISSDLFGVFSQPPISSPGGVLFSTGLSNTFKSHLYSINGTYAGLVPGTPPVPGPPFLWAGVS